MNRPRAVLAAYGALWVLGVLPACETGSGSVRPAPGVSVVEDGDADAVALLRSEPGRPFLVVGSVRATADARLESRVDEARAAAERALRRQGASVGADAVIIDRALVADYEGGAEAVDPLATEDAGRDRLRPGGAAYATRPVKRVVLTGRAVRWADGPDTSADPATGVGKSP